MKFRSAHAQVILFFHLKHPATSTERYRGAPPNYLQLNDLVFGVDGLHRCRWTRFFRRVGADLDQVAHVRVGSNGEADHVALGRAVVNVLAQPTAAGETEGLA